MKAWYFCNDDMKLRYGDGRYVAVGTTHSADGKIELCKNGLHASERLIDALGYAPGNQLFLVELSGDMDVGIYKVAAQHRTYLKHIDATNLLREFARKQALVNIEKIKPYCPSSGYETVVHYLKTGDVVARSAAWSAARSAESAARSAARSAAESAAESAARSAARSAAESARSAAWSAESAAWSARSAAWSAESAAWSARSAAWSAAWSAAESAANDMLTTMVEEAMS